LSSLLPNTTSSKKDKKDYIPVQNYILVSGGCITSMLLDEEPNDFDVYFTNKEVAKEVLKIILTDSEHDTGHLQYESTPEGVFVNGIFTGVSVDSVDPNKMGAYDPICVTENAITFNSDIQLILRFCGDAEEIHKNFDFVHCTNYWTYKDGLVVNQPALESIITKELRYEGSRFPICSMIRTRKFIKRGWDINAGQFLKIALQISDLDLKDPEVLRDQLVGVDVAYFLALLSKMSKLDLRAVDNLFIMNLIDETFDEHLANGDITGY